MKGNVVRLTSYNAKQAKVDELNAKRQKLMERWEALNAQRGEMREKEKALRTEAQRFWDQWLGIPSVERRAGEDHDLYMRYWKKSEEAAKFGEQGDYYRQEADKVYGQIQRYFKMVDNVWEYGHTWGKKAWGR